MSLDGVPASYVPPQAEAVPRSGKKTIDLSLLRRTEPPEYLLDAGDVLGIYIEGVLGRREEAPPVHFPQDREVPPTLGFPIPVRDDGTISLPLLPSIAVRGLTLRQLEDKIRAGYTEERRILQPGRDRILVSLQQPRRSRVLVIRQEAGNELAGGGVGLNLGVTKRGMGRVVSLPAYKNDVLHALAETGGLPGLDAENMIYVIRRKNQQPLQQQAQFNAPTAAGDQLGHAPIPDPQFAGAAMQPGPSSPGWTPPMGGLPQDWHGGWGNGQGFAGYPWQEPTVDNSAILKIPVRLAAGEQIHFTEQDIILYDGDIVFIESRDTEIFYTGGLLGGGQYTLPRDYDLDVLGAISIAQGQNNNGTARNVGGVSSLNQDVSISASSVVILRQMPNGTQIPIHVDLNRALRCPRERVIIQPGDYVILRYTPMEAVAAFVERHLLESALFGLAAAQLQAN